MLFFWVILFVATFLGSIALVFYLTIELNEIEKVTVELSEKVKKRYAIIEDEKKI
jgi:archaellum component FlaG (FlaF/FlaG flagellin family)